VTIRALQPRRSFLDRPLARMIAVAIFVACAASLGYLERARVWPPSAEQAASDDPFARCYAERAAQIDQMLADGLIQGDQAAQFKSRAEAMCRAQFQGPGGGGPPPPGR
jgi:hypothetical protein